jgi:trans-2,3-dihydro-3-hydroxyanthranilate isomerase
MPKRPYEILDVFTETPLAGNPLAVVHEADGLPVEAMQRIAREFNLSETIFLKAAAANDPHTVPARIFTPAAEIPFAGHPTIGALVALTLKRVADGAPATSSMVALDVPAGRVRGVVTPLDEMCAKAEFDVPRLPELYHAAPEAERVAAALSLSPADVGGSLPVSVASAGVAFTFVPLTSLDALERARVDTARHAETFPEEHAAVFVFATGPAGGAADFRARMFAPNHGITEDPATGSAVAAFAAVLAGYGHLPDGEHVRRIHQGVEMGRPSEIGLEISIQDGEIHAVRLSGAAVRVAEGALLV